MNDRWPSFPIYIYLIDAANILYILTFIAERK